MGCDIHCYVEVEQSYESNGKKRIYWRKVGNFFKYNYYKKGDFPGEFNSKFVDEPQIGRNYDLFSILAGVRNGTWGEEVKPISEPRGIPDDVSDEIKKMSDEWDSDGHSHSYLYLDEIKNYDWHNQKIKHSAFVSKKQKKEYEQSGKKPTCYAAWSSSGVQIEWEDSIAESIGKYFFDKVIPELEKLKKWGKVRIVFWFDN